MNDQLSGSTRTLVLSYQSVRRAIGGIGLLLPIILGPLGWLTFGIEIQDNISSYYHTVLRDVFVGSMCAIGIFLFLLSGLRLDRELDGKLWMFGGARRSVVSA